MYESTTWLLLFYHSLSKEHTKLHTPMYLHTHLINNKYDPGLLANQHHLNTYSFPFTFLVVLLVTSSSCIINIPISLLCVTRQFMRLLSVCGVTREVVLICLQTFHMVACFGHDAAMWRHPPPAWAPAPMSLLACCASINVFAWY